MLREFLDNVYDWQAQEVYFWFHAKDTLNALDSNGKLERYPGEATKGEIEDLNGETESDVGENITTPSSSTDGGYEYSDNTTSKKTEAAEVAKEGEVGEEAVAAEKDSTRSQQRMARRRRRLSWTRRPPTQRTNHLRAKQRMRPRWSLALYLEVMRLMRIIRTIRI